MRSFLLLLCLCAGAMGARTVVPLDRDWRFLKGHAAGAEKTAFDDGAWRKLDVPHDWSIEGPFDEKNPTGGAGAFLPAGIGWYRKHFTTPKEFAGRRVFVEFDGVMANSDVWINGVPLGKRPFGYVTFRYELTKYLQPENVLSVLADNSQQPASRWYAGAGIYRHVRLIATDAVHIEQWGTFVSTPKVSAEAATVRVQSAVVNQSDAAHTVSMTLAVEDARGRSIASAKTKTVTIAAAQSSTFDESFEVKSPELWNLESPAMYRLVATVEESGKALDAETTKFGIRDAHFEAATGFWLNGKNFKLKGVCLHHEAGGLGAAVPDRAWERRIAALKELGVNAIRTAHNPPSPEFLDLCDRMGVVVMDEMFDVWTAAKNPYDYHLYFRDWSRDDTRDTVKRDRNHPSVVLYSAGNEIRDTPNATLAKGILRGLVDTFHEFDPTRPVTQALFRPNVSHDYDNGLSELLDVVGQNYRENELVKAHEDKPSRKIVGTETQHDRRAWLAMRDNAAYAGQFLWTGIDYLGESRRWPAVGSASGLLDRTGALKPAGMERQSWWSEKPVVHVVRRVGRAQATPDDPGFNPLQRTQSTFADWTPSKKDAHEENVEVYSNCDEVELSLNGKSLGSQALPKDASPRMWTLPFVAGTLRAVGRNKGQVVASEELRTAGAAVGVLLSTDRGRLATEWDDVAYVTAQVVDAQGVRVPEASDLITFKIAGPGVIAAVDNADIASHELFQTNERHAYQGRCVAIVRANGGGRITVSGSAAGLTGGSAGIEGTLVFRTP